MSPEIIPERMAKVDGRSRGRSRIIGSVDSQIARAEFDGDHALARRLKLLRCDLNSTPEELAKSGVSVTTVADYIAEAERNGDAQAATYWRGVRNKQAANS